MKLSTTNVLVVTVILWLFNILPGIIPASASAECTSTLKTNGEDVCELGKYLTNNYCCECNSGKFNAETFSEKPLTKATSCKICPAGRKQPNTGQDKCVSCVPGKYSTEGARVCSLCPKGQFQSTDGSKNCETCPLGYSANSEGNAQCNACEKGHFTENSGSEVCSACPIGQFTASKGSTGCGNCPVGRFAPDKGSPGCTDCPPGKFQASKGSASCVTCKAGRYQDLSGQDSCKVATVGYFAPRGSDSPSECPVGRYASSGGSVDSSCEGPCSAGRYCNQKGLTSPDAGNLCPAGKYSREGETSFDCTAPCPAGFYCPEGTGRGAWIACGTAIQYCPEGAAAPKDVPDGYYSTPMDAPADRRSGVDKCPQGYYCQAGERFPCPEGRYGNSEGMTSESCTADCYDGYYCPEGSASPQEKLCSVEDPQFYCVHGIRESCASGFYTLPENSDPSTRTDCKRCSEEFSCRNGRRFRNSVWKDKTCALSSGSNRIFVDQVKNPSSKEIELWDPFQVQIQVEWNKWKYNIVSVTENGRTRAGIPCSADVTEESLFDIRTKSSNRNFDGIPQKDGQLVLNEGAVLVSSNCDAYDVSIKVDTKKEAYRSCAEVPHDGHFEIDPFENEQSSFVVKCKNGFTRIDRHIARNKLDATLTSDGEHRKGFLDGDRPYSVDRGGRHRSLYDIPIPFGFTHFYLESFEIRAASFLEDDGSHTSETWGSGPSDWNDIHGDFAFGSKEDNGPVTGYSNYPGCNSHSGTCGFGGNNQLFSVNDGQPSLTFRMFWGEAGWQHEGWIWEDGYIWVKNEKDDGSPFYKNIETTSCTVQVALKQDNSPPFREASVDPTLELEAHRGQARGEPVGKPLVEIFSDPDGDELTFSLVDSDGNLNHEPQHPFSLSGCTGQLTVSEPEALLDTSDTTFTIYVLISDNFRNEPGTVTQELEVMITQPNRPPTVSENPPQLYVVENAESGTPVYPEKDKNGDEIGGLLHSGYVSDPDGNELSISMDSCSTETFCKAFKLDKDGMVYVQDHSYLKESSSLRVPRFVRVKYSDGVAEPVEASIPVRVRLIRSPPTIVTTEFGMDENAEGLVGVLIAEDESGSTFTYHLEGIRSNIRGLEEDRLSLTEDGNINVQPSAEFQVIRCADGHLCGSCDDYDEWIKLIVKAEVIDRSDTKLGPTISTPTEVEVRVLRVNSPPRFREPETPLRIMEGKTQAVVKDSSEFFCDKDAAMDETHRLFYEIVYSNKFSTNFTIGETSGILRTRKNASLDYEWVQEGQITIQVRDNGSPSKSIQETLTISVVDVPEPPIVPAQHFQVNESTTAKEGYFGKVVVEDIDKFEGSDKKFASPTSTFAFEQLTLSDYFSLDMHNGEISVTPGYVPDYERSYPDETVKTLSFRVIDTVNNVSTLSSVTLEIMDVLEPPFFNPPVQNFTLNFFAESGTSLGKVEAADRDLGDSLKYLMVSGPEFVHLTGSGQLLYVPGSSVNLTIYDVGDIYSFEAQVTDSEGLQAVSTHFVHITNLQTPPMWIGTSERFSKGETITVEVDEHHEGIIEDFQLECKDENDLGVGYQLLGSTPNVYEDIVRIRRDDGQLEILDSIRFDYEEIESVTGYFAVACVDHAGLRVEGSLILEMRDVAEAPRILELPDTLSLQVREDRSIGYALRELRAFDRDASSRNNLIFSAALIEIHSASPATSCDLPIVPIDSKAIQNGHGLVANLSTNCLLDYYNQSQYVLNVSVTDEVGLSDVVKTTVDVLFVNTPPEFEEDSYQVSIAENSLTVAKTGEFPFFDRNKQTTHEFTVIDNDGMNVSFCFRESELIVDTYSDGGLNYESDRTHQIRIRVTDEEGLFDEADVQIVVENVNDLVIESVVPIPEIHSSSGESTIRFEGRELGPIWREATILAQVASPSSALKTNTSCLRTMESGLWDNTMVSCLVPPGVGKRLQWTLFVDEDSVVAPTLTAYDFPVLSNIVEWPNNPSTQGGQRFSLQGFGFGPIFLESAEEMFATPVNVEYRLIDEENRAGTLVAESCSVMNDTVIDCHTSEGVGKSFEFRVTVPFSNKQWMQVSEWMSFPSIGYGLPSIIQVSPLVEMFPTGGMMDAFLIEGENFGPSLDFVSVGLYTNDEVYHFPTTCSFGNHTALRCALPVGIGTNFTWYVTVQGQSSGGTGTNSVQVLSYDPPVLDRVTDIVGREPEALDTKGGELITLHGSNFGPDMEEGESIIVQYGESLEYTAKHCRVKEPHKSVECLTVPGVGKNHSWRIQVGSQSSNILERVSNYNPPVVAMFDRPLSVQEGIQNFATSGNETVYIHGSFFGPPGTSIDLVEYGNEFETFQASHCKVLNHEKLECRTAPGAGSEHAWSVVIGGQESERATTSYEVPKVIDVRGVNGTNPIWLSTLGGEWVDVVGDNFGPPDSAWFLESVTYGPTGTEYVAEGCFVVSHERVRCGTVAGHGQRHRWIVTVFGQSSLGTQALTSYAAPVIKKLHPLHGPTGFSVTSARNSMPYISLSGHDLGANLVDMTDVKVLMDSDGAFVTLAFEKELDDWKTTLQILLERQQQDPSNWLENVESLGLSKEDVDDWIGSLFTVDVQPEKVEYGQTLQFQLPNGFGADRPIFVQVGETFSSYVLFDYREPRVTNVAPSIPRVGSDQMKVTIDGENFCAGPACGNRSCCGRVFVNDELVEVPKDRYSHEQIIIFVERQKDASIGRRSLEEDTNTIRVGNLDQNTTMPSVPFQPLSPSIAGQQKYITWSPFATEGGQEFKLFDVEGIKSNRTSVDVKIGNKPCTNVTITSFGKSNNGLLVGNVSCLTPPNVGTAHQVRVNVSKVTSPAGELFLDYAKPQICLVELLDNDVEATGISGNILFVRQSKECEEYAEYSEEATPDGIPTTGARVRIHGKNFGSSELDYETRVTIGELFVDNIPLDTHDHRLMELRLPPGAGGDIGVTFTVGPSTNLDTFVFRYQFPSIRSVSPPHIPTLPSNSYYVLIHGSNFGPPSGEYRQGEAGTFEQKVEVWFEGEGILNSPASCTVLGSNHSVIECQPPIGQGDTFSVQVTIDGLSTGPRQNVLSYKEAEISEISQESGPTSGRDNNEDPIIITLKGENFGRTGNVSFGGKRKVQVVSYSHKEVQFRLPEGFGTGHTITILPAYWSAGKGSGNGISFDYDPPAVYSVHRLQPGWRSRKNCEPFLRCQNSGNRTNCIYEFPDCFPTTGHVPIEVNGTNFGPREAPKEVHINGRLCLFDKEAFPTPDDLDPHTTIVCTLFEGVGRDLPVTVSVGSRTSPEDEGGIFSFDPPRIDNVKPSTPDAEGARITFGGANFGPGGGPIDIKLGNVTCQNPKVIDHGEATCVSQADEVGAKSISLFVAQRDLVFPEWLEKVVSECKRGWYGLSGEECLYCEDEEPGAVCPGGERLVDKTQSKEGWWKTNDTTPSSRCHEKRQDRDKCPVFLPCIPKEACRGNNRCAEGYTGYRCSSCEAGTHFRINGVCKKCPQNAWLLGVFMAMAVVGAAVGGYIINSKGIRLAAFTIGVDYFQVLALFARTRVQWPSTMETTLQALSFFNLNLELAAPDCYMQPAPPYQVRWLATMGLPLAVFSLLVMMYIFRYLYKLLILRSPASERHTHVNALIASIIIIMYILYIFLTRMTLDVFNCAPTDPPDGNLYMAGRTDIVCWESPVHTNLLFPLALITLLLYVIAFPAFALMLLRRNKAVVKHDQILRAHGTGHSKHENPNYVFRRRYQRLYHLFKPGKWYWVIMILLRKFLIALTSLMFRSSPTYQLSMTLLVVFAAYVFQVRYQPYMSRSDFQSVIDDHTRKVKDGNELHVLIQKKMDKSRERNAKRPKGNSTRWDAQKEKLMYEKSQYLVSEPIIRYLTDFNTVEAVLLGCAILINLSGIMFLSSRFAGESLDYYRTEYEALGVCAMVVVILSAAYFLFVFGYELLFTFYPEMAMRCLASCSCGRSKKVDASKLGRSSASMSEDNMAVETQLNPLTAGTKELTETSTEGAEDVKQQLENAHEEIRRLKGQGMGNHVVQSSSAAHSLRRTRQEFSPYLLGQPTPVRGEIYRNVYRPKGVLGRRTGAIKEVK